MPMQVFDVWDQAALTEEITRPAAGRDPGAAEDAETRLGETLAPNKSVTTRTVKQRVRELKPFGVGQFRAPDGSPAVYSPELSWQEKIIGLVILEEIHPIEEEEWMKLESDDENVLRSAGVELVERGRILRLRNERLTEAMRWDMLLNGKLTITYPGGNTLQVDYDVAADHLPTLTAGARWSQVATADPVADIQTWSELMADDAGFYARHLYMTSKTFDYLIRNTKIINTINFFAQGAAPIQRPRKQDILEMFTSFAVNQDITIYDNGYRAEGEAGVGRPSLTKYLPDNKVLVLGPLAIEGVPIAQTLDGQVMVLTDWNKTENRQGFQAEVLLDGMSRTHYLRASSARIPRLNYPDAVIAATVA